MLITGAIIILIIPCMCCANGDYQSWAHHYGPYGVAIAETQDEEQGEWASTVSPFDLRDVGEGEVVDLTHFKPCPQDSLPPLLLGTGHCLMVGQGQRKLVSKFMAIIMDF